ncbi:MAG: alpha/beta hydrolase [Chitinophagaceae bacterium]|nr:alpha/beta hydrolase [Rubrivivax sp.]
MELAPIVLVHGFIGSLDEPTITAAFHPHPVFAPPLLGYGVHSEVDPSLISLSAQAEHVASAVLARFGTGTTHLLGHSVGGAVAAITANTHPERIASLISVEGNFTLKDAFWSASVGRMSDAKASEMLAGFRADPAAWLLRSGVAATPQTTEIATRWLAQQTSSTLRVVGRSVVETTGASDYQAMLRSVFARTPVHLVAGERTREGWDVPVWAEEQAASFTVLPKVGHLMRLEKPEEFGRLVTRAIASAGQGQP